MIARYLLRLALFAIATLLTAGCATSPETEPAGALSASDREAVLDELAEILRTDQQYRSFVSWGTTDPEEIARFRALDDDANMAEWQRRRQEGIRLDKDLAAELMAKQGEIDRQNLDRIADLTRRYGYPGEAVLGADAPDLTAVLIHAPTEQFAAYRPLFKKEVLAGRMGPKTFAMMVDRSLQNHGGAQLYGTAKPFDPQTGTVRPPPIESIEVTNAARAEIGLEPLEEYSIIDAADG